MGTFADLFTMLYKITKKQSFDYSFIRIVLST